MFLKVTAHLTLAMLVHHYNVLGCEKKIYFSFGFISLLIHVYVMTTEFNSQKVIFFHIFKCHSLNTADE